MRRMWAAVAAIAVCLALGALPVSARSPAPPPSPVPGGLTGSIWLQHPDSGKDVYYLIHPDGTIVVQAGDPLLGLGVWQPTGERTLASTFLTTSRHGTTTHRSRWVVDEAGETATMTYAVTEERADGTAVPEETGTATLTRLHFAPLPADAISPTPAEPAWQLALGPAINGVGTGRVATEAPAHGGDPLTYHVSHADGTYFYVSPYAGDGVGLWVQSGVSGTGDPTAAITGWLPSWPSRQIGMVVGESMDLGYAVALQAGTSDALDIFVTLDPMSIVPPDPGSPLPARDAAPWPASGAVWMEPTTDGLAITTAYLADGTVISVHPEYGTGVGLWQPIDDHTIASSLGYGTLRYADWRVRAESTISQDGETLSTTYKLKDRSSQTPEEAGSTTATRVHLEPLASSASPAPSPAR
jgi:hypothetical protein